MRKLTPIVDREHASIFALHLLNLGRRPAYEFIRDLLAGHDPVALVEGYSRLSPALLGEVCDFYGLSNEPGAPSPAKH